MSKQVNMYEAKTHFSKLAEEVEAGAEIIVARSGRPVLKLVRIEEPKVQRQLGWAAEEGKDFDWAAWDELDKQVAKMWNEDDETN